MGLFLRNIIRFLISLLIVFSLIHFIYEVIVIKSDDSYIGRKLHSIKKKEKIDLLIMGDSRAERQLSPKIIDSILVINSINLAISSGDINRIRKFFMNNKKLLDELKKNKNLQLIISASDWQVNDESQTWGYLSHSTFSLMSPMDRLKSLNRKVDYLKFMVLGYKLYAKSQILKLGLLKLPYSSDSKGFVGINEEFIPKNFENISIQDHPHYSNININGWRYSLFEDSIRYLNLKYLVLKKKLS